MELIRNTMPTDLNLIKKFRDELVLNLKNKKIDENLIFKIKLILDELIINSYKHGNRCQYNKIIDTTFILSDDYCLIKVKDEGEGIDYLYENNDLSDHGRGIKLVYTLADDLIIKDNLTIVFLKRDNKIKLYI